MAVRSFPVLPARNSVTDDEMAEAVEAVFRTAPGWTDDINAVGSVAALGQVGASATELTVGSGEHPPILASTGRGWFGGLGLIFADADNPATKQMLVIVESYDPVTGAFTGSTPEGQTLGTGTSSNWIIGPAPSSSTTGKQAIWVPARALIPRTTNGPELASAESVTNKVMSKTLLFDATTPEYCQFDLGTGNSWDGGTISARFVWSHGATTVNFKTRWGVRALALGDGDPRDTAFGVAQYVNDTGGTTDDDNITDETPAVTASNSPAAGKRLIVEFLRKADDAVEDTLAVDAALIGVWLYITFDQGNDA